MIEGDRFAVKDRNAEKTAAMARRRKGLVVTVVSFAALLAVAIAGIAISRGGTEALPYAVGTDVGSWTSMAGDEFLFGAKFAALWPVGIYQRAGELKAAEGEVDFVEGVKYLVFPHLPSRFSLFRMAGVVLTVMLIGWLLCWLGLKTGSGILVGAGVINFVYLVNVSFIMIYLEVTK